MPISDVSRKCPAISVETVSLRDGSTLRLNGSDLVVITGPNNSGKSLFLREVFMALKDGPGTTIRKIISGTKYGTSSTPGEVAAYCAKFFGTNPDNGHIRLGPVEVRSDWFNFISTGDALTFAADVFIDFVHTTGRIEGSNPSKPFDRTQEAPTGPIQRMFKEDPIEAKVSNQFRQAFNADLIVHRHALVNIPLYVGDRPKMKKGETWASTGFLERLESLERLEDQGDGMRSFATVVTAVLATDKPVLLIDEPEAFLHPPQARLLGRIVANERQRNRQVFVATHSADFIKGVMESPPSNLHFGRITREQGIHWIDPADTRVFAADPFLRTTNALDSVLHEEVVLTESDRDSVFYQAILDASTPRWLRRTACSCTPGVNTGFRTW